MKIILPFLTGLLIASLAWADASQPMTALRVPIDSVIVVLKDPQYQDDSKKEEQYNRIRRIIEGVFDFKTISQLAVGRYWRTFTNDEKTAFISAFSELLSKNYIQKIQGEFQNETVDYVGEQAISDDKTVVKTKIIRENADIPVDYSMRIINDAWKVYDVIIEGVSLVKNYRTQFGKLLINESPRKLIQRIEDKNEKQKI